MRTVVTRRNFLKTTGALAGTATLVTSAGAAQSDADYVLGGKTAGWIGRQPASIEGQENPPISLTPGEEYTVRWENVDGAAHNFAIKNEAGDNVVESSIMGNKGETQTVSFTATENMTTYYCVVHPGSMEGPIKLSGGGGQTTATGSAGTPTATASPTPTPTATEEDGGGDGASNGSGPGFGIASVLAGVGATTGYLLWKRNEE